MSAEDDRQRSPSSQHDWMAGVQARDMDRLEELVRRRLPLHRDPPHPEPMTREQWMGAAREGYTIVSFAYEPMDIDIFGDTAIIHSRYSQVANYQPHEPVQRVPAHRRLGRIDGRWQVVARHSSILS